MTEPKTAKAALELLQIGLYSKRQSRKPLPVPTDKVYEVLKKACRDLEKCLGLPKLSSVVYAIYKDKEFKDFKFPELALVEGKPSIIVANVDYPADKFLKSAKFTPSLTELKGNGGKKIYISHLKLQCDNANVKQLPLKIYASTENELDEVLLESDKGYLKSQLLEYIFSSSILGAGTHLIEDWGNEKFPYLVVKGRKYYSNEIQIQQLEKRRAAKKETNFIVEEITVKDKETNKERSYFEKYVEGYKRATYFKSLIMKYRPEIPKTSEELEKVGKVIFETPFILNIKGIEDGIAKQKVNDALVEVPTKLLIAETETGNTVAIVASSFIDKVIKSGKFEGVTDWDDVTLTIKGVEHFNGYCFSSFAEWSEVKIDPSTQDKVISSLAGDIGIEL
ncbi:MAG: hypothetical protein AAF316_00025 [Cyanobacteria bacterium P01_A01_bin.80]